MNVQSSTRYRAVLGIYEAHRKPHGGCLSLRELERDWKRTGLRRADLEQALQGMVQHGLLQPRPAHEGLLYELTYIGECAMQTTLVGGLLPTLRDWLTLRRAKRRVRQVASSSPRNRRAGDRQPEASPAGPDGPLLTR